MSRCCIVKAINIVNAGSGGGGGGLNTIYSADGDLISNRIVSADGNNLTFDMGASTFTVSGVVTTKGATLAAQPTNPGSTETLWTSGINLYLGSEPASLLPVATEGSGTFTARLNHLTPINTSGVAASVTPPTALSVNSRFELVDSRGYAATNNIVVNFSGGAAPFYGASDQSYTINTAGGFTRFRYLGATIGWVVEK